LLSNLNPGRLPASTGAYDLRVCVGRLET
jgi:hypothetical protein